MNIYFDTEFSSFTASSQLISFGAITETGEHFYIELPVPSDCTEFVRLNVLPLFDGKNVASSMAAFENQLAAWLSQWPEPMLIADSTWGLCGNARRHKDKTAFQGAVILFSGAYQ